MKCLHYGAPVLQNKLVTKGRAWAEIEDGGKGNKYNRALLSGELN